MTSHALLYREILWVKIPTRRRVNCFPLVCPKIGYSKSSRKNNRNEARSINDFFLSIILVRGGLALVSEHQLNLPVVMLRTIPSWFRRHFVGIMFWYGETGATRLASGGNHWLQFSNNGRRGRSRDQITKVIFSSFLKFSFLYNTSSVVDVFNHSFWKLYIKTINDLDPGLNLPETSLIQTTVVSLVNLLKRPEALARYYVTSNRPAEWVKKLRWKTIELPPPPPWHY